MIRRNLALAVSFSGLSALALVLAPLRHTSASPPLDPASRAALAALEHDPARAGAQVYEGAVSPLDPRDTTVVYRYDRRVHAHGVVRISSHITHARSGAVVVLQRARHDDHYRLQSAEMIQAQAGTTSAVTVTGDRARFTLERAGRTTVALETIRDPLVAGPTIFGYILTHWQDLAAGRVLPVRFAVLERSQSIGFTLARAPAAPGRTVVRMTPSNPILRLFVATTSFEFETDSRRILGYAGRVPTLERVGGGWRAMDARVRYAFTTPSFR